MEDIGAMADATAADCTALRPLALKLAKVYKPCALQFKKTELVEGVGDTHGLRSRRKEDKVDWFVRVVHCQAGILRPPTPSYCGVVALLEKHE